MNVLMYWEKLGFLGFLEDEEKLQKAFFSSPEAWYVTHLLFPSTMAVVINLLIGNLPACFRELRVCLEGLACCYTSNMPKDLKNCQASGGLMRCIDKMLRLESDDGFQQAMEKAEQMGSFIKIWNMGS